MPGGPGFPGGPSSTGGRDGAGPCAVHARALVQVDLDLLESAADLVRGGEVVHLPGVVQDGDAGRAHRQQIDGARGQVVQQLQGVEAVCACGQVEHDLGDEHLAL
ncbi:hypothetical protein [Streptomyces sp. NPDC059009]|uniref:hypothetical protein n=1 Tax=Streptomyces sp. NPDC059009 TaxID=3346694 RepID=UPI003678C8D9